jgi:hypothetical protein
MKGWADTGSEGRWRMRNCYDEMFRICNFMECFFVPLIVPYSRKKFFDKKIHA